MNTDKITPQHKARHALVYVRQSTATQVLHNRESQERQYALRDRAAGLGFAAVELIDEDLGCSGSGLVERPGFARLLERVFSGEIGAVLALEASRLARNNRDWHHLVDFCAMADTLVIDHDGVYDARLLNDRLLLGLKGTMSEFELGLMRQRAQEALRQKIARGEVLHTPPTGYERTEDNRLEMTPDLQVQQAIKEVFARFRASGSARQTLLQCQEENLRLPSRDCQGHPVWRPATMSRILTFLKNPAYAGAFVHGRTMRRTVIKDGRQQRTGGHARPRQDWSVVLREAHPGYIAWVDYESNQRILEENAALCGKMRTAAKGGAALLSGLLRCGHCARPLHVSYRGSGGKSACYRCQRPMSDHGRPACCVLNARRLEEAVAGQVLAALQPAGLEAACQAQRLAEDDRIRSKETQRLVREKARYEADRCRRQFEAVEPENRLVVAELERRWNVALQEVARLEAAAPGPAADEAPLAPDEIAGLRALGADLTAAWEHPAAPVELKKRILRTVIEEIMVRLEPEPAAPPSSLAPPVEPPVVAATPPTAVWPLRAATAPTTSLVTLTLHWAGGTHTTVQPFKKIRPAHPHATPADTVELIRQLARDCTDEQIAPLLNRHGLRTGKGLTWKAHNVADARRQHAIAAANPTRGWLTLEKAAAQLGTTCATVRRLIKLGVLPAQQVLPHAPWCIAPASLHLPHVLSAIAKLKKHGRCGLPRGASSENFELPLR